MVFNSLQFIVFFIVIYLLFLLARKSVNLRNIILLIGSYVFYGAWDWRFLFLIALSTFVDYFVGINLQNLDSSSKSKRRYLVLTSIVFNLGMLSLFKYFDFFTTSFSELFSSFGFHVDAVTLNIILPVGISFYTFQTLSYSIDIYRGQLEPTRNFITFATFVAFFPQLVAGPIERASNLLPQLSGKIHLTPAKIHSALFLILWGYFKKVAIADNVAQIANVVFEDYPINTEIPVFVGLLAFTIQIYCDFSGYSDIARGVARMMGIELIVNFRLPYFALSPSDFWERWHISLSTWLRDYVYIPLGGNRQSVGKTYRNLMLTMLLGGLWHGAAWNFVLWGAYHGSVLILYRVFDRSTQVDRRFPTFSVILRWCIMISITLYGWLLFRASSLEQIAAMSVQILNPTISSFGPLFRVFVYSMPLVIMQIAQAISRDLLIFTKLSLWFQVLLSALLIIFMVLYGFHGSSEFIYFQF